MIITKDDLITRFQYHQVSPNRGSQIDELREHFRSLGFELASRLPQGRESALALTKLEEAMFWASASIARQEPEPVPDFGDPVQF